MAQAAAGKAAVLGMLRTINHWHEDWTPLLAGEDECQALLKRGELPGMVDGLI